MPASHSPVCGLRQFDWAVAAPLLCAVHCLATPFLVAAVPVLELSPAAEWAWFGVTLMLASHTVFQAVRLRTGFITLLPILAGLTLWAVALADLLPRGWGEPANIVGGVSVAVGMIWSARRRHSCGSCLPSVSSTSSCHTHA